MTYGPPARHAHLPFFLFALVSLVFASLAGACGSKDENGYFADGDGGTLADGAPALDGGGTSAMVMDGGSFLMTDSGPTDASGQLVVTPTNQTLNVTVGQAIPTLQFTAKYGGASVTASWSIDRGELGSIGAGSGLLTPAGTLGGVANITATFGTLSATVPVTIFLHVTQQGAGADAGTDAGLGGNGGVGGEGPGPDPGSTTVGVLNGTPKADSGLSWLYPYDKTVWPRGLLAPLLQWQVGAQGNYDGVYVHITGKAYEYKGYFGVPVGAPTPFQHHPITQSTWYQATYSTYPNGGEALTVALTFSHNGVAYGPISETWTIAQGTLEGTVYYNSYGTALVHNSCCAMNGTAGGAPFGGATLAIRGGSAQNPTTSPVLVAGFEPPDGGDGGSDPDNGCRVCHSVSANGASLLTQRGIDGDNPTSLYELTAGTNDVLMPSSGGNGLYSWAAIYPDGTFGLSNAWLNNSQISEFSGLGMTTNTLSQSSGVFAIPPNTQSYVTTGLPANFNAATPAFSPDGKHVAFNFSCMGTEPFDCSGTVNGIQGDSVSLASMDVAVNPGGIVNFSNFTKLLTPGTANGHQETCVWPSFLPGTTGAGADGGAGGAAVAFELEVLSNKRDFGGTRSTCDLDISPCVEAQTEVGTQGELWWVDLSTQTPFPLYALNGKTLSGTTATSYLPTLPASDHTAAAETELNFEPTVNPVASGGYAWVVFTSRRLYGNIATINPYYSDPRFHDISTTPTTKKLWVAAIDLNAAPGTDPSHPAFYLPAQELLAGNSRGFWVVDPCEKDGTSCETGDQCCGGFCRPNGDGGALVCSTTKPACANVSEKCSTTADCCGASQGITCVGGYCAVSTPK